MRAEPDATVHELRPAVREDTAAEELTGAAAPTDEVVRPSAPPRRVVAAFDFDGTITTRDTVAPFLALVAGRARLAAAAAARAPWLAAVAVGRGDRDAEKERIVSRTLGGRPIEDLRMWGLRYAGALAEERPFRPAVMERLAWHRDQGHEVVIVSASLDLYLVPLARRLGIQDVLATRLEVRDGVATGQLEGGNCRGPEKANRLQAFLAMGRPPAEIYAYGDSAGDDEMLAMAHHAYRLTKGELPALG